MGSDALEPKLSFGWQNRTSKHINNCRWPVKCVKSWSSKVFSFATIYILATFCMPSNNTHKHSCTRVRYIPAIHNSFLRTAKMRIQLIQVILRSFACGKSVCRLDKKMHRRQVHHFLSEYVKCSQSKVNRWMAVIYLLAFWVWKCEAFRQCRH